MERNFDNNQSLEDKIREITRIIQEATSNNIPDIKTIDNKKIPEEIQRLSKRGTGRENSGSGIGITWN